MQLLMKYIKIKDKEKTKLNYFFKLAVNVIFTQMIASKGIKLSSEEAIKAMVK